MKMRIQIQKAMMKIVMEWKNKDHKRKNLRKIRK